MDRPKILINRAPVLTLWTTTVAERLGFNRDEALSLGKAVAGLNAQSKGRRLGIYKPVPQEIKKARAHERGEEFFVEICGRQVPAVNTEDGVRAVVKDKPIDANTVERYLESKFGDSLDDMRAAMRDLTKAFRPEELSQNAFSLYEKFRPAIPEGVTGWGAKGTLEHRSHSIVGVGEMTGHGVCRFEIRKLAGSRWRAIAVWQKRRAVELAPAAT
jgi:hypothetical protein